MGKHLQTICLSIFIFFCSACNYKFPAHEVLISSEQMGKQYNMIYLDSAGRSFQNYADNIVKQFQQTFSYAYDASAVNRFNNCDRFIILNDTEKEIFEAVLLAIKEDSTIINPPSDSE
ncbi:MAG: hypothetical protein H7Y00_09720, partial [Fimbriimonadaceae bacterium]|nr:hypothetical protein [Chitinophagales bacterium]